MNVMRMEKGFKGAGELTNEVTLAEADVLRFASTDKPYLGRDLTLNTDLPWVCAYLEIEPDGIADGHGGEAVLHKNQVVGSTASIVFGPTVGKYLLSPISNPKLQLPEPNYRWSSMASPATRVCWANRPMTRKRQTKNGRHMTLPKNYESHGHHGPRRP